MANQKYKLVLQPSSPRASKEVSSATHWCSDGFEITCDNGEKVRIAVTLDWCNREAISWAMYGATSSDARPCEGAKAGALN
jgi:transposase InsO family protein